MYTWQYIKNAILYKLDIDETEAITLNYYNKFVVYANEAMTHICYIKPKKTFYEFNAVNTLLTDENGNIISEPNVFELNTLIKMPSDFISFGDDVNEITWIDKYGKNQKSVLFDDAFSYVGTNYIRVYSEGTYNISYNARWIVFDQNTEDNVVIDAPTDVLDCIASYVASQCFKTDDENKSALYRNEFEMFLSRLDDTDFKSTKTFTIGGDW